MAIVFSLPAFGQVTVSGTISTPSNNPVCDILVSLFDANDQMVDQEVTDTDGNFSFPNIDTGSGFTMQFAKEDVAANGTSTFDLVLYARAILGITPLSTYQQWTADVNNSGASTTLDLIMIRKVILGIDNSFPAGLWLFGLPDAPQGATSIPVSTLAEDLHLEIFGVKIGDANFTAVPCN